MKSIKLALLVTFLASPAMAEDLAVRAFKEVCLATAPSFAAATAKSKKFGISEMVPSIGGMTKDGALSIQIKPNKECATTSAAKPGNATDLEFRAAIKAASGVSLSGFPAIVSIKGATFIVQHDRHGGEAYVLLKK